MREGARSSQGSALAGQIPWPEKLREAEGLPQIGLISKGCVPPRYKTLSEHSTVHITPHLFSSFLIRIFQLMSTIPARPNGQAPSPLQDPAKGHLQPPGASPYSSDRQSHSGSDVSLHRVKNVPGYNTPVFKGKEEQRAIVQDSVAAKVGGSCMMESGWLNLYLSLTIAGFHPSRTRRT